MLDPTFAAGAEIDVLRVESARDLPAVDERSIDVALLDMNHGYANVSHDAIVLLVRDAAWELREELALSGRHIRVVSYAVRDKLMVPEHESGRHRLYLGTGGPGHLDPRRNTADRGVEEIREDPSWEAPLWRLFDAIAADEEAALYGVCHTFGLLCRWSGAAEPVLRSPEKGGPMSGIGTNVLTPQAIAHPWFASLGELPAQGAVPVLDSRHYDLIPPSTGFPGRTIPIAFEAPSPDGRPGEALTMLEVAREPDGSAPRIFGVNSHPEIGSPERVRQILDHMLLHGTITSEIHQQRSAMLGLLGDPSGAERLAVGRRVFSELALRRLRRLARAA